MSVIDQLVRKLSKYLCINVVIPITFNQRVSHTVRLRMTLE